MRRRTLLRSAAVAATIGGVGFAGARSETRRVSKSTSRHRGGRATGTGDLGYLGPCSPEGDPQHTYLFTLFALEAPLDLEPGASYQQVLNAAVPKALARARYVGQYERG